jgi:hypothetical protein
MVPACCCDTAAPPPRHKPHAQPRLAKLPRSYAHGQHSLLHLSAIMSLAVYPVTLLVHYHNGVRILGQQSDASSRNHVRPAYDQNTDQLLLLHGGTHIGDHGMVSTVANLQDPSATSISAQMSPTMFRHTAPLSTRVLQHHSTSADIQELDGECRHSDRINTTQLCPGLAHRQCILVSNSITHCTSSIPPHVQVKSWVVEPHPAHVHRATVAEALRKPLHCNEVLHHCVRHLPSLFFKAVGLQQVMCSQSYM